MELKILKANFEDSNDSSLNLDEPDETLRNKTPANFNVNNYGEDVAIDLKDDSDSGNEYWKDVEVSKAKKFESTVKRT